MLRMLLAAVVFAVVIVTGSPVFAAADPGAVCKEAKAKAAGKKAFDLLKAFGKNNKKPDVAKFDSNISKAQSKFTKGFTKAEAKGGCNTSDDSDAIEATVDAFVADVVTDRPSWTFSSPDGLLVVEVAMRNLAGTAGFPDSVNPYYRLERDGVALLDWSPLGIRTADSELIDGLQFVERTDAVIEESYVMKLGKRSVRTVEANQTTLAFRHTSGAEIHIVFRVADDGMAYRYQLLGAGQVTMVGEASAFHVPADTEGWMQPYWKPTLFTPSHEWSFYRKVTAGEIIEEGGCDACPPDPEAPISITISSEVTSVDPALAGFVTPGDPFDSLYFVDEAQPNEVTPPDFLATDPGAIQARLVLELDGAIDSITVDSATGRWELQGEIFFAPFAAWVPIQVEIVSPLNSGLVPDLTAATSDGGVVDLTSVNFGLLGFDVKGVSVAPGGHPLGGGSLNGWGYGALFEAPGGAAYVMFAEADLDRNYAGTHLGNPEGTLYPIAYPDPGDGQGVGSAEPTVTLPWTSPWRVVVAGTLADVVGSTLVEDLGAPQDAGFGSDPAWILPGRSAWSWWSQGTGTPELQMEYIDFAEEMGWEYVLVDANWNLYPDPDSDIPALVNYAAERGVGIWLWYNSGGAHNAVQEQPRDLMVDVAVRQAEMQKIAGWGVKGVKVDFFHSDKQERISQYLDILEDARDQELLVNFHGATLPRGWQRTYPNLMSMEAVRGAEWYQFDSGPDGIDNVLAVLTRNVLGSMDYTPVTFSAAFEQKGISYAHQLALSVVFESGVQHFADRADSNATEGYRAVFAAAPVVKSFLEDVPTAWDDTLLVEGDPDSHVVVARRKAEEWYLGIVSGLEQPLSLSIPLDFLGGGSYTATIIGSGATATEWSSSTPTHTAQDSLAVDLLAKDGLVARFVSTP